MLRTETQIVKKGDPIYKQLDELLFMSKNMYNYANYLIRQEFIKTSKEKEQGLRDHANWLRGNTIDKILNSSKQPDYIAIPNASSQQVLRQLDDVWKSFFASIKDWKRNPSKYKRMPKPPKYKDKKNGRNELTITTSQFSIKNGLIRLPKKTGLPPVKTGVDLTKVNVKIVRLVPMNNDEHKIEIVYEEKVEKYKKKVDPNSGNYLGIDLGLNNLMALTSNKEGFNPKLVKGGNLKTTNQYYNKTKSKLQSELMLQYPNRHVSRKINRLTSKRNHKVEDTLHKASNIVRNICFNNNISKVVIGLNKQWKSDINIGKQNNQNFVGIPHSRVIEMLIYKLEEIGCEVIVREESYTSQASAIDLDFIPTYGEEGEFTFSGKRIKRGLYKTKEGILINADVNGSYNILRKEFGDAVMPTDRGLILNPISIYVDVNKNKH